MGFTACDSPGEVVRNTPGVYQHVMYESVRTILLLLYSMDIKTVLTLSDRVIPGTRYTLSQQEGAVLRCHGGQFRVRYERHSDFLVDSERHLPLQRSRAAARLRMGEGTRACCQHCRRYCRCFLLDSTPS